MEDKMNKELLLPDTLTTQIEKRLAELENTLNNLKESQKEMPHGHLRIAQKGDKRPWFYHYTSPDNLTGNYIRKKDTEFAKALAQKDYNESLIQQLQKEINTLQEYLTQSQIGYAISKIYEKLCPARQALITPVTLTHEQYITQWKNVTWQGHPFTPDTPIYDTANKEQVRSKSEVIIADALYRHGIPYRYEYPVELFTSTKSRDNNEYFRNKEHQHVKTITLHPDFLCLNVHTRQEYIWEHFGLMDDPDYAKNAASKLRLYAENNIFPGRNLILTMETQTIPLSTRTIEKIITEFLS